MDSVELRYLLLRARFLRRKDEKSFRALWKISRHLTNNPSYNDFKGYDNDHWDSLKMEALYHALVEYTPRYVVSSEQMLRLPNGHMKVVTIERQTRMSLVSFIRSRYVAVIKSEQKKIIKNSKQVLLLDTTVVDDEDKTPFDTYCLCHTRLKELFFPVESEENEKQYHLLVCKVIERLKSDREALRYFAIKLRNPVITNRAAAIRMHIPKVRVSCCRNKVGNTVRSVIEQYGKERVFG